MLRPKLRPRRTPTCFSARCASRCHRGPTRAAAHGSQFPCTNRVRRPGPREVWQTKRRGDNYLDGRGSVIPAPSPRDPLLGEIVRRLVDVYRPERIYLFGSTARGDAGPDSSALSQWFYTDSRTRVVR